MNQSPYQLFGAQRSSATYRVRLALQLKDIPFVEKAVDLQREEHAGEAWLARNRQGLVPSLQTPGNLTINQSLAIIDYLEEMHPEPPLLPRSPADRAAVRALALYICCEMHPLNNMRVRNHIKNLLLDNPDAQRQWMTRWNRAGFDALERQLSKSQQTHKFCFGESPGLADICLVPQVFNARFFGFDVSRYPAVERIAANCGQLPAFQAADPDNLSTP